MKSKNKHHSLLSRNLIILSLFFLFVLYVVLRSNLSSFQPIKSRPYPSFLSICNKLPLSLSESLVHYATTNRTLLQTFNEISITRKILESKSPCNFLIFGLGHDSLLWASLNHNGRTVFLEESIFWLAVVKTEMPSLEMYHVAYDTRVSQASELLIVGKSRPCQVVGDPRLSKCPLALKNLPSEVYETEWDLIMVDAPMAYMDTTPGRMTAIYTAGLLAKNRRDGESDVFVHDVDRRVEDEFSKAFLCEAYTREEVGRLRHFVIPSHRNTGGNYKPFCP